MPEIRMFDLTPSPMPLSRLRPAPFRSRRCFLPLSAVAAFLALAGLAATAAPQEPSQQPGASAGEGTGGSGSGVLVREGRPVFEESVEVHLMNVEVFVSDRKGRPIRGLEVEDFELYENGELMEITHFAEAKGSTAVGTVDFGRGKVGGEGADTADLPAFTESSVVAPSYLVVFVDNTHLRPAGR
ncbi:MAG: hypothetical protein MI919_04040, partial [Holophagales bacterium]|nr:hypothetical protein [Holophagales bacterium]